MMIKRLYRQHSTVVMAIPKPMLEALDLKAGDYVELEVADGGMQIRMEKIVGRLGHERKNTDGKSEHDRGRRT